MQRNDPLENEHNVSRYVGGGKLDDDGRPAADAFKLSESDVEKAKTNGDEPHLSVNWLEYYELSTEVDAVEAVRQTFRDKGYNVGSTAKFVVLNVGETIAAMYADIQKETSIRYYPDPTDLSHSGIFGIPWEHRKRVGRALADLVAEDTIYPAK